MPKTQENLRHYAYFPAVLVRCEQLPYLRILVSASLSRLLPNR